MRLVHVWKRIQRQFSRWLRTIRRDGLDAALQAARDQIGARYQDLRRRLSLKDSQRTAFPFIEPTLMAVAAKPRVSILIPVYNGLSYVKKCITALYAHPTEATWEVIVVDQASTDGSREYLQQVAAEHPNFRLVENSVNVGFPRAVNQGAAQARGDLLMVLNSDVILAPGCIDRLVAALDADPKLAIVSSMTNYVGRGSQVDPEAVDLQPDQVTTYADHIADRSGVQPAPDHLVFFCVMLRRDVFDFLGGMSEVYGLGNYEDNDFCLRARMLGFSLGIVPNAFAFHFGSRTFEEQRLAHTRWMERNEQVYYERAARLSTSRFLLRPHVVLKSNSLLTVAIDASTDPKGLTDTLTSLAHQTTQRFEVVAVGAAALDEVTLSRFEELLDLRCVDSSLVGSAGAWNKAISLAQGTWLMYMRAGDVLYPTHVAVLLSMISVETPVVCTGLNESLISYHGDKVNTWARRVKLWNPLDLDQVWAKPVFPAPAFAHARNCLDKIGKFDPAFEPLTDWEFLLRMAALYPINVTDTISGEQRIHLGSFPEGVDTLLQLAVAKEKALHKVFSRHPLSDGRVKKLRDHAVADWKERIRSLQWLAAQNLESFSRAEELASIWFDL